MKRLFALILMLLLLSSCTFHMNPKKESEETTKSTCKSSTIKGVWISCYELNFSDKSEINFVKQIDKMFCDIKHKGFNTVFVHVRSHCDAFYKSKYYPFSSFVSGKQGVDPGYDPLEIMCYFANMYSLKIHAWINPFRILSDDNVDSLSENNPAKQLIISKSNKVKFVSGGYYFNPAYKSVRTLIINGIKEILENYNIDGIHFDDYFYPTTDKSFDKAEYEKANTSLSLYDWRRENINKLVKQVYKTVKKSDKIFGISPHCSFYYNYNTQYADIEKWCKQQNYIDYIAPQIYFGFETNEKTEESQPLSFKKCFQYWKKHSFNKPMYIGLALYKCGDEDGEWKIKSDIISRQIKYLIENKADGYIVFSYSYFDKNKTEISNAIKIIKAS